MALVTRALTGSVILPDGTSVSSGQVKFFPVGQLPADIDAMLVRYGITFTIVDGEISGNIIAPCNYRILVYFGNSRVVSFRGGITETDPPDPLTLQQIYAANVDADDVVILQGPAGSNYRNMPETLTRTGDLTFTMPDVSNANLYDKMFQRGTIFRFIDSEKTKLTCVHSAVYADDVVTFTLMGDRMSESVDMTTVKYFIEKSRVLTITYAGSLVNSQTDAFGYYPVPYPMQIFGADVYQTIYVAGGAQSSIDVLVDGLNAFDSSLVIPADAVSYEGQTARSASYADTGQRISGNIVSGNTNKGDVRINIHFIPRYIYLLP